jgi:hypothetical protein
LAKKSDLSRRVGRNSAGHSPDHAQGLRLVSGCHARSIWALAREEHRTGERHTRALKVRGGSERLTGYLLQASTMAARTIAAAAAMIVIKTERVPTKTPPTPASTPLTSVRIVPALGLCSEGELAGGFGTMTLLSM